jgi:hypothetical protein
MKRFAILTILALAALVIVTPPAMAQEKEHVNVGVFADYLRLHHADNANYWGLGGLVGFGAANHVTLEASMAYDFEKQFTTTTSTGGTTTFVQSNGLRLWHGMFGPKIYAGSKHAQVFGFLKGGFLNFHVSGAPPTSGFPAAVGTFTTGDTNGAFYPGGGVQFGAGPIALRIEAGDLMYFDNGANHNLNIRFGPVFTF